MACIARLMRMMILRPYLEKSAATFRNFVKKQNIYIFQETNAELYSGQTKIRVSKLTYQLSSQTGWILPGGQTCRWRNQRCSNWLCHKPDPTATSTSFGEIDICSISITQGVLPVNCSGLFLEPSKWLWMISGRFLGTSSVLISLSKTPFER